MDSPKKEVVRQTREEAGLTQTEAAGMVYVELRAWQHWEAGTRPMHPAFWELFRLKTKRRRK